MTIKEIAKIAGVSITAVSFYLNNKQNKLSSSTVQKLDKIIEETGYKPSRAARNLRLQVTNKVALMVFDIYQNFAQQLFKSLTNELVKDDLVVSLYESHLDFEREKAIIHTLIEEKANTIVIQPSKEMLKYLPTISRKYPDLKTKIILIDSKGKNKRYGFVYNNADDQIEALVKQKAEAGAEIFYYISNEISKLQTREYRYSRLEELSKKYNVKLETVIFDCCNCPETSIDDIAKGNEDVKKVFWTNNSEITFETYKYLDANNHLGKNNSIVAFNECFFRDIVKVEMDEINTNIQAMGIEAARQIKEGKVAIKSV